LIRAPSRRSAAAPSRPYAARRARARRAGLRASALNLNRDDPEVREIRMRLEGEFRIRYIAKLPDAVYVMSALEKK
jgi:phage-related protein